MGKKVLYIHVYLPMYALLKYIYICSMSRLCPAVVVMLRQFIVVPCTYVCKPYICNMYVSCIDVLYFTVFCNVVRCLCECSCMFLVRKCGIEFCGLED